MAQTNNPSYVMTKPTGSDERNRLDLQHEIWLLTLDHRLHSTIFASPPRAILDIGCGTATWAIRMANMHPSARLTATDIHLPHLPPPPVPPNFHFVPFNANDAHWPLPPATFDFIHGRINTSGIHDWSRFLANCHHHLAPGGHLELLDVTHPFRAEKPTADNEATSAFIRFGYATERAWALRGINYRATATHGSQLAGLGFEDVQDEVVKWPLGEWASSYREQEMKRLNKGNFEHFLRSAGVALLGPQNQDLRANELIRPAIQPAFEKIPAHMISPSTQEALNQSFPGDWPHIEYLVLDQFFANGADSSNGVADKRQYVAASVGLVATFSRGNVSISSADTAVNPVISPNWLEDARDQDIALAAFRRGRELFQTQAMKPVVISEAFPGVNYTSRADLLHIIRASVNSVYNAAGTSRMGRKEDLDAVVNSRCRVIGVKALRVVDASAFPFLPPGQPSATVYALAEKIAEDMV